MPLLTRTTSLAVVALIALFLPILHPQKGGVTRKILLKKQNKVSRRLTHIR